MLKSLESLADSDFPVSIGVGICFDFAKLRDEGGSVFHAADAIHRVAQILSTTFSVIVHRKFLYLDSSADLLAVSEMVAKSSAVSPRSFTAARIPLWLTERLGTPMGWWLAATWMRACQDGYRSDWSSIEKTVAAHATLPPPSRNPAVRMFRQPGSPLAIASALSEHEPSSFVIAQDFVGYERKGRWGTKPIGVGVAEQLQAVRRRLGDVSGDRFCDEMYRARARLQDRFDDFEIDVRSVVAQRFDCVIVPGAADGSMGNDGALVIGHGDGYPDIAESIRAVATTHGLVPSIELVTRSGDLQSALIQSESCLAATKVSAHLGHEVRSPILAPCWACIAGLPAPSTPYERKYAMSIAACGFRVTPYAPK